MHQRLKYYCVLGQSHYKGIKNQIYQLTNKDSDFSSVKYIK